MNVFHVYGASEIDQQQSMMHAVVADSENRMAAGQVTAHDLQ
jgi:hypothetical protein